MLLKRSRPAINGVFAVTVDVLGERFYGVANVGARPTVKGKRTQLEVHIFDYAGSLYGEQIKVYPVKKLRDEHKFDSFDELKQQIQRDAEAARTLFGIA